MSKKKKTPYIPKDGSEEPHPLLIPLLNFQLRHDTYSEENEKDKLGENFIGRDNLITQLVELLENTYNKRGSYLIAGYRGSGKTSLINRVISIYKKSYDERWCPYLKAVYRGSGKTGLINDAKTLSKKIKDKIKRKKVISVRINLGHDEVLDTRHVLFNIISDLRHEFNVYFRDKRTDLLIFFILPILLTLIIVHLSNNLTSLQHQSAMVEPTCASYKRPLYLIFKKDEECFFNLYPHRTRIHPNECSSLSRFNLQQGFCYKYLTDIPYSNKSDFFSLEIKDINILNFPVFVLFILALIAISLISNKFRGFLLDVIFFGRIGKQSKYFLIKKIQILHDKVAYSFEKEFGALNIRSGMGFRHKTNLAEMKEPQIELELLNILERCNSVGFDIIFVFDELDKISLTVTESNTIKIPKEQVNDKFADETIGENVSRRKKRVDSLLASLKTLITVGKARFFFIAGRDMLDSYQSEKGSTSSLYESLFNQVFEVPSFLTDDSDLDKLRLHSMIEVYVCRRLIDQGTAELYWLANQLCITLMNDQKIIDLIAKYQPDKNNSDQNIIDLTDQLLNTCLSTLESKDYFNWSQSNKKKLDSFFLTRSKNEKNNFRTNIIDLKGTQLSFHVAIFVRSILVLCLSDKKIKREIKTSSLVTKLEIGQKNYSISRLNIYYLYLLHFEELSKRDTEVVIGQLRHFINYLAVHSWGNCKRLTSLFESFTKPISMSESIPNAMGWLPFNDETQYMLHFGVTEIQRINMGSNLYIMFNHHLSRQFTGADKLVVSTMAALHYCLKFHRSAFSRHHLFRMTEMMSSYSSPELNSIFETTLTQVLWPYVRVVRNGMFSYRFFTWIEQEIRYIARVNDLESASYTFSLDAINNIKEHYRKTLENVMNTYKLIEDCSNERGPGLIAEINIVLGDIYFLERGYDESVIYYQTAVNAHHNLERKQNYHLECLMRFVEALLKLGNVQEHRQRYERAAMNYYQAKKLVDEFLEHQSKSTICLLGSKGNYLKKEKNGISGFLTDGDSKWVLLKQPYWVFLYLNIKRGNGDLIDISIPKNLYGKNDPYGGYHQGQLCFYLGRYEEAENAFIEVISKLLKLSPENENDDKDKIEKYYSSYLIPKTCINLAQNVLVLRMRDLLSIISEQDTWELKRLRLTEECWSLIKTMEDIENFKSFELKRDEIRNLVTAKKFSMKEVLQLIFYSAKQYEKYKSYDHAAMAYLKAVSLWVVTIDMLPLNYLDSPHKSNITNLVKKMYVWLDEASNNALRVIKDSNGQAHQQAMEKWYFKDLANNPLDEESHFAESLGYKKIEKLHSPEGREELSNDISFLQGSYLEQQLMAMLNWAYTIKRTLSEEEPYPLKSYRLPVFTTRSLILSAWATGRERLEQARRFRLVLTKKATNSDEKFVRKIIGDLNDHHKQNDQTGTLEEKDCYYIISAKAIHNFYTAIHYTRILVDNNQAIIIPPPAFVILNLWRTLYRLVQYEKDQIKDDQQTNDEKYEKTRVIVRAKLMEYVSQDIPTSHLDLDYAATEAVSQLRGLSTMADASSASHFNILHNKYFLNDDHEDPGFHLEWTLVQLLIPSSIMLIKWIEEDMKVLKNPQPLSTAKYETNGQRGRV